MRSGQLPVSLLWPEEARAKAGLRKTTFYDYEKRGLIPRGVKLTRRTICYPSDELEAVVRARIAGKTDDEVRALVAEMHAKRAEGV